MSPQKYENVETEFLNKKTMLENCEDLFEEGSKLLECAYKKVFNLLFGSEDKTKVKIAPKIEPKIEVQNKSKTNSSENRKEGEKSLKIQKNYFFLHPKIWPFKKLALNVTQNLFSEDANQKHKGIFLARKNAKTSFKSDSFKAAS